MKKAMFTLFVVLSVLVWTKSTAQQDPTNLYETIIKLDSTLFHAFNTCDIETFQSMFSTDLEFYHDTGGLTDYNHTVNAIRTNCERKLGLIRTLVQGSLEVYPIKNYGAIQIGSHQFCHPENGKQDCGTFKFVHIWKYADGQWKITRVVSYDH
jgi:hypothetical protein